MVWAVISVIDRYSIKKYEDIINDRNHCILCKKVNTNAEHDNYLEMAEKNWYLG